MSISNANLMYYYPFDTNLLNYASGTGITDSSAISVSISNTTTKLTSGSLYFNGASNESLQIPNTTFDCNGITIAFWLKLNVLPGTSPTRFIDFGYGTASQFAIGTAANNILNTYQSNGHGTGTGGLSQRYTFSDTNWHHFCLNFLTTSETVYVDGTLIYNQNRNYSPITTMSPCFLGKYVSAGYAYLNAYMNQLIVFNRSLSYSEIDTIYNNPTSLQFVYVAPIPRFVAPPGSPLKINNANLIAYYPFNTDMLDYSTGTGVSNTTSANVSISASTTVLSSGSLFFPSSTTQYVKIPAIQFNNGGVSLAFWMKCNKTPLASQTVFDFGPDLAYVGNFIMNFQPGNNPAVIGINLLAPSISTQGLSYNSAYNAMNYTISDIGWHHFCITMTTSGNFTFYVDGINTFFRTDYKLYPSLNQLASCLIGSNNTTWQNSTYGTINCNMNQFVLFNRVITLAEIYALANFPAYVQFSSESSNLQYYTDSYVVPKGLLNSQITTVAASYSSPFLNPTTTYTLKNQLLTSYGTNTYNGAVFDLSFALTYQGGLFNCAIATDKSGNIYSAVTGYTSIFKYSATGSYISSVSIPTVYGTRVMAFDSSRNLIYLAGENGSNYYFYVLTVSTFTVTTISIGTTNSVLGIAISPINGSVYVTTNTGLIGTIDITTGAITTVYSSDLNPGVLLSGSNSYWGAAFDTSGNFYTSRASVYLYKFNPTFKIVSLVFGYSFAFLACDTTTNDIYTINRTQGNGANIFKIKPNGEFSLFSTPTTADMLYGIHYDNLTRKLFVTGNRGIYRYDLTTATNPTLYYRFSSSNLGFGTNALQLYDPSNVAFGTPIIINVVCFREGTLIRCLDASLKREVYMPVEHITKDTFIKTFSQGYKRVEVIGYSTLLNPNAETVADNRLFCYKAGPEMPALFEDLYITGNHSVLVEEEFLTDDLKNRVEAHMGEIYKTEGFVRLPACLDQRAEPFVEPGEYKIWHFALENDDIYANYGVYANGLLVETSSIRYMTELSKMTLL